MLTAKDIMSKNVVSVHSQTSVAELAELLTTHHISVVPVVDDA